MRTREKFLKELKYLKDETTFKILWSLFKSGHLTVHNNDLTWENIKETLVSRAKEMKPKILTDIIVLSTKEKGGEKSDFFERLEPEIILKMREMTLDDLINLLWSAIQIKKGSLFFYEKLEEELAKRIRSIKDDQFETLISCFAGDNYQNEFTDKFFKLVVNVVREKRDRFTISTLVNVIWSFAKIDFNSDNYNTLQVLQDFAVYERLI